MPTPIPVPKLARKNPPHRPGIEPSPSPHRASPLPTQPHFVGVGLPKCCPSPIPRSPPRSLGVDSGQPPARRRFEPIISGVLSFDWPPASRMEVRTPLTEKQKNEFKNKIYGVLSFDWLPANRLRLLI